MANDFVTEQLQARAEKCLAYLGDCVEEGWLDDLQARELADLQAWDVVEGMMERGDAYANDPENFNS